MEMYIDRLSKAERKQLSKELLADKEAVVYRKARRMFYICLVGMVYAGIVTAYDIINQARVFHYFLDGLLIVVLLFFGFKTYSLKRIALNKYAISKKNQKDKPKKKK